MLRNMKKNILWTALLALIVSVACTDEDKFKNEVFFKLERGGFVRFVDPFNPLIGANSPDSWTYDIPVWDPNNNLSSYTVSVIGGDKDNDGVTDTTEVNTITDFGGADGVPINITAASVAAGLGVDVSTFSFGQSFRFIATATRNDGVVFTMEDVTADFENNVFTGNTQENLEAAGYFNAMRFSLTIACPGEPDVTTYPGQYVVTFGNGWFEVGQVVTVVAGPGENDITIQNLQGNTGNNQGSGDYVVSINSDQTLTPAANTAGWTNPSFGTITFLDAGGGNFTFECANHQLIIRHTVTVAAGSFGNRTLRLEKQ